MLQDYDFANSADTFVQTANPTPPINIGWQLADYDQQIGTSTFVQTANPTPPIAFAWSR